MPLDWYYYTWEVKKRTTLGVDGPEAVVAHLVHEAVEEGGGALLVHAELPLGRVVVRLVDVGPAVGAASNTHHPQELVDVYKKKKDQLGLVQKRVSWGYLTKRYTKSFSQTPYDNFKPNSHVTGEAQGAE